jgi:integrase
LRLLLRFSAEKGWTESWLAGRVPALPPRAVDPRELAAIHAGSEARSWERAFAALDGLEARMRKRLERFGRWLRDDRELSVTSVRNHLRSARAFLLWVADKGSGGTSLRRLTAGDVERFFVGYRQGHGPAAQRSMQAALRHVLRFCAEAKWIALGLAHAVPTLHAYRLATVPKGLSDEQIARGLEATAGDSASGARDRAILLLLATYGVRRGHVLALRLRDVDWEGRTIRFLAHKGGKPVIHVLTAAVAQAVAHYVEQFRPRAPFEEVFLQIRHPWVPMRPASLSGAVRERLARAGVAGGPHAFRHSFATRLLRAGQPLKVIADLLGHRDLNSAAIYAKADLHGLRRVAVEWPEVLR